MQIVIKVNCDTTPSTKSELVSIHGTEISRVLQNLADKFRILPMVALDENTQINLYGDGCNMVGTFTVKPRATKLD